MAAHTRQRQGNSIATADESGSPSETRAQRGLVISITYLFLYQLINICTNNNLQTTTTTTDYSEDDEHVDHNSTQNLQDNNFMSDPMIDVSNKIPCIC